MYIDESPQQLNLCENHFQPQKKYNIYLSLMRLKTIDWYKTILGLKLNQKWILLNVKSTCYKQKLKLQNIPCFSNAKICAVFFLLNWEWKIFWLFETKLETFLSYSRNNSTSFVHWSFCFCFTLAAQIELNIREKKKYNKYLFIFKGNNS